MDVTPFPRTLLGRIQLATDLYAFRMRVKVIRGRGQRRNRRNRPATAPLVSYETLRRILEAR